MCAPEPIGYRVGDHIFAPEDVTVIRPYMTDEEFLASLGPEELAILSRIEVKLDQMLEGFSGGLRGSGSHENRSRSSGDASGRVPAAPPLEDQSRGPA